MLCSTIAGESLVHLYTRKYKVVHVSQNCLFIFRAWRRHSGKLASFECPVLRNDNEIKSAGSVDDSYGLLLAKHFAQHCTSVQLQRTRFFLLVTRTQAGWITVQLCIQLFTRMLHVICQQEIIRESCMTIGNMFYDREPIHFSRITSRRIFEYLMNILGKSVLIIVYHSNSSFKCEKDCIEPSSVLLIAIRTQVLLTMYNMNVQ